MLMTIKQKTTIITRSGNLFEETLLLQLLLPADESSLHRTVSSYLPARIIHTFDSNHTDGVILGFDQQYLLYLIHYLLPLDQMSQHSSSMLFRQILLLHIIDR